MWCLSIGHKHHNRITCLKRTYATIHPVHQFLHYLSELAQSLLMSISIGVSVRKWVPRLDCYFQAPNGYGYRCYYFWVWLCPKKQHSFLLHSVGRPCKIIISTAHFHPIRSWYCLLVVCLCFFLCCLLLSSLLLPLRCHHHLAVFLSVLYILICFSFARALSLPVSVSWLNFYCFFLLDDFPYFAHCNIIIFPARQLSRE